MNQLSLTFVFLIFFTLSLPAQRRPFDTGLIFDDETYNNTPHLPRYGGEKYTEIPLKISLREFAPIPKDQGLDGACTAWAAAYGGLTICRAIKNNSTDKAYITASANSAYYVFNQTRKGQDCSYGAKLSDALDLMKNQGSCLAKTFDDRERNCSKNPSELDILEAANFKLKDYAAAFSIASEPDYKINKTKKLLAANSPVVIGMNLTESFWLMEPGESVWHPSDEEQGGKYGHALLVVGYDEVKKSFELMNSWGPDWGDEGFFWMNYDDFGRLCKYGFQMILDDKTIILDEEEQEALMVDMTGTFVLRYPTGYITNKEGNQTIAFEEASVVYDGVNKIYKTKKERWKVGDVFQLVAKNIPAGKSAYIFSIDATNKLERHWPAKEQDIDALDKVPIANFVPSQNAEIVIPDETSALQINHSGIDNLIILFSDETVADMDNRLQRMVLAGGSITEQLAHAFGDLLVAPTEINYVQNQMSFKSTFDTKKGFIVPIILSVVAQ